MYVGVLNWALDNGCLWAVNDRGDDGQTGLHYADNVEVMEFLISRGANIDAIDEHGRTPLYAAVKDGLLALVTFLVRAGADVNIADANGITPLGVAINNDSHKIAAMLRDAGAR